MLQAVFCNRLWRKAGMSLFGKGVGRICAVVATSTASKMTAQIRQALRQTPTVELRLDWLRSDLERSKVLAWGAKKRPAGGTFLATSRRRGGGGFFPGTRTAGQRVAGWRA